MQQTANYQLKKWDKQDRILMQDFNDNSDAIDAALAAEVSALAAETAARKDAVAAEAAARKDADAAEAAARAAAVQAARDACPVVKLRETVTSAAANQIDLSLSGLDWERYGAILIFAQLKIDQVPGVAMSYSTVKVRLNGISKLYAGSDGDALFTLRADQTNNYFSCFVPQAAYGFACQCSGAARSITAGFSCGSVCSLNQRVARASFTAMNFVCEYPLAAGAKFTILGVKL